MIFSTVTGFQKVLQTTCRPVVIVAATILCVFAQDVRQALAERADIYELGPDHFPITFWRLDQDDYKSVDALLQSGLDINIRGFYAKTPAIWAAQSSNWKGVKFLIDRGADIALYGADGTTVAGFAKTSRLRLDSEAGRDLEEVRAILMERGLYDNVPTPKQLRDQMAAGKIPTPQGFNRNNWPPRE